MTQYHQALTLIADHSFHGLIASLGLEDLANHIQGNRVELCNLDIQSAAGCAHMRWIIAQEHFIAELVALGLTILVAVMVGSLAVAFVNAVVRAMPKSLRSRIHYAPLPANGNNAKQQVAA